MNKKPMSKEVALDRLEALCAVSERCESELRQKLWQWSISSMDVQEIMAHLRKHRFVDDERYARAYVRDKYRIARWGRNKIVAGLMAKKIASEMVRKALEEIDQDEYESNARDVITGKMSGIKDVRSYEGRTKLFRYGVGRGYESELVARIIKDPRIWDTI